MLGGLGVKVCNLKNICYMYAVSFLSKYSISPCFESKVNLIQPILVRHVYSGFNDL